MSQVKVPKFLEIEDKIISVGGFGITWKQFLALVLGLGGGYISTKIFVPAVGVPIMLVSVVLGGAIAFGRVNDRPFVTYLGSAWRFFYNPHTYVWKKVPSRVELPEEKAASDDEAADGTATIAEAEQKLAEIAKMLDE